MQHSMNLKLKEQPTHPLEMCKYFGYVQLFTLSLQEKIRIETQTNIPNYILQSMGKQGALIERTEKNFQCHFLGFCPQS